MLRADEVEVQKLIQGNHMSVFWEGTRNMIDHRVVQKLKNGPAHTAIRASQEVGISVLPVGVYFGGEPTIYKKQDVPKRFTPTVHIGMPIPVESAGENVTELTNLVYASLQDCQDVAVSRTLASR